LVAWKPTTAIETVISHSSSTAIRGEMRVSGTGHRPLAPYRHLIGFVASRTYSG
jgi:hypothetical protein